MGRGKLKLQLMSNSKARRKYFEKRKKSVEKAAKILSTLCGVDIAVIVYSPDLQQGGLTTWSSQPGNLAGLIASYKAAGSGNKTYSVSDFLKEKKMEEEEGKLDLRAMEEDRAGLVAKIGDEISMRKGEETSSLFTESSSPVNDPETWTYEQLSAANFDCYSVPAAMVNYGGGGGGDLDSNGGMCLYAEPPLLTSSYNVETSLGSYDFVSEFLDMDSCFSSGGQSFISPAANWFLNEEQSGDRFMMSPLVLAS